MHSRRRIRRALRPVEGTREHIVNSLVNVILLMKSIALRNPLWRKTMAECTPCKMYSCECQYWVPCRKFKEFKRTVEMKRIGHVFKHTTPVTPARYKLDPRSSSHCGKCGHAMDAHRAFETHRPVSYFLKLRVDLDIIELFRRKDDKTMEEQFFESVAQLMRKAMSSSVFLGECVKADTNPYFSIPLTALQGTSILNAVISYVFKYTRVQTTMVS
ncbi:uncharacterized protein [Periplaneta americana]|uniref:uncharacterized protein n=1 Tax=Periplaneta americana TaxID=6978 RepID=UPI0037E8B942